MHMEVEGVHGDLKKFVFVEKKFVLSLLRTMSWLDSRVSSAKLAGQRSLLAPTQTP